MKQKRMVCPKCLENNLIVRNTKYPSNDICRRERVCTKCGHMEWTTERIGVSHVNVHNALGAIEASVRMIRKMV